VRPIWPTAIKKEEKNIPPETKNRLSGEDWEAQELERLQEVIKHPDPHRPPYSRERDFGHTQQMAERDVRGIPEKKLSSPRAGRSPKNTCGLEEPPTWTLHRPRKKNRAEVVSSNGSH